MCIISISSKQPPQLPEQTVDVKSFCWCFSFQNNNSNAETAHGFSKVILDISDLHVCSNLTLAGFLKTGQGVLHQTVVLGSQTYDILQFQKRKFNTAKI